MECFKKAIKLNLISPDDMNGNGSDIENLDKYKEAIEYLEKDMECLKKARTRTKSIELNPIDGTAYNRKYFILSYLDKNEEALECIENIVALNPNDLINALNKYKDAILFYDKAIELKPNVELAHNYRNIAVRVQRWK